MTWVNQCSGSRTGLGNTFVLCPRGAERGLSPCCRSSRGWVIWLPCPGQQEGKHHKRGRRQNVSWKPPNSSKEEKISKQDSERSSSGKSKRHGRQWRSRGRKLNTYIYYANLQKFGTKCFFEKSCSNADTWLIVQNLGKSIQGLTWNFGLQFVFLGMGKLMRHGFFFSIAYNEFHLLDILEFTLFICK